jgi:hypothetical protein
MIHVKGPSNAMSDNAVVRHAFMNICTCTDGELDMYRWLVHGGVGDEVKDIGWGRKLPNPT